MCYTFTIKDVDLDHAKTAFNVKNIMRISNNTGRSVLLQKQNRLISLAL